MTAKQYLFIGGPIDGEWQMLPEDYERVDVPVEHSKAARYYKIPLYLDENKGNDRFIFSYEYMTVPQIIDALLVNYQRRQEDE